MDFELIYHEEDKNETLRLENSRLTSKADKIEVKNAALEATLTELRTQLEVVNSEVTRLTTQITQQEEEVNSFRSEKNCLIYERDQLLKMSDRKDNRIEHLNELVKRLEKDLQSSVEAKFEAIRRLDEIEGKQQSLDHKEKQMAKDLELKNIEIASLRDSSTRNMNELVAIQQNSTSANMQLEIDLKQKNEELRIANCTICQLNETNQSLTNQYEEIAVKFKDHTLESGKLILHFQNELDAKIKLSYLYKEKSDDYQALANEPMQAGKEMQLMQSDTTDQCDKFETELKGINEVHQLALDDKNEEIANLKEELKVANEILKTSEDENAERILENFIPSAAEELNNKKQDYNYLKIRQTEYKETVAINEKLKEEIDTHIAERVLTREENQEMRSKYGHLERENAKLKQSTKDLARQVVYLMSEIEGARGGTSFDHDQSIASDTPANEVITTKLVTFNNIVEMQDNNQKLLLLVRHLSNKLEEMEEIQNSIDIESYEAKVASYEKRLHYAEQSRRANEDLLANCIKDRDRFIRLYHEIMRDACKKPIIGDEMEGMDDDMDTVNAQSVSKEARDRKLADVEKSLQDKIKELKELKDQYTEYRNENKNNVRGLKEELLAVRNELKELTLTNCKLSSQANFANEQIKTQQNNVALYKNKIQTLKAQRINESMSFAKELQDSSK